MKSFEVELIEESLSKELKAEREKCITIPKVFQDDIPIRIDSRRCDLYKAQLILTGEGLLTPQPRETTLHHTVISP